MRFSPKDPQNQCGSVVTKSDALCQQRRTATRHLPLLDTRWCYLKRHQKRREDKSHNNKDNKSHEREKGRQILRGVWDASTGAV